MATSTLLSLLLGGGQTAPEEDNFLASVIARSQLQPPQVQSRSAGGGLAPTGDSPGDVESLVKRMAARRGWTGREWRALEKIIEGTANVPGESHWALGADNPTSTAIGFPQRLESAHPFSSPRQRQRWIHSPKKQADWFLDYVGSRYHNNPLEAWRFKREHHWY
jgi:hypothetical protein